MGWSISVFDSNDTVQGFLTETCRLIEARKDPTSNLLVWADYSEDRLQMDATAKALRWMARWTKRPFDRSLLDRLLPAPQRGRRPSKRWCWVSEEVGEPLDNLYGRVDFPDHCRLPWFLFSQLLIRIHEKPGLAGRFQARFHSHRLAWTQAILALTDVYERLEI